MKIVAQRVQEASVTVEDKQIATIGTGLLLLVGIAKSDTEDDIKKMADTILKLRVFPGGDKDINTSVVDIQGSILAVSQFTLLADTTAGNRPSFIDAAQPERAKALFDLFVTELKKSELEVQTGAFGEYMKVHLINDGPVTIVQD